MSSCLTVEYLVAEVESQWPSLWEPYNVDIDDAHCSVITTNCQWVVLYQLMCSLYLSDTVNSHMASDWWYKPVVFNANYRDISACIVRDFFRSFDWNFPVVFLCVFELRNGDFSCHLQWTACVWYCCLIDGRYSDFTVLISYLIALVLSFKSAVVERQLVTHWATVGNLRSDRCHLLRK